MGTIRGHHMCMEFLTITQVSQMLSISESNIRRLIRAGEFPVGHRLSPRCRRWRRDEVEEWSNRRRESPFRLPSIPDRFRVVNRTGPLRTRRVLEAV